MFLIILQSGLGFLQVDWSVYMCYARAIGLPFALMIVGLYAVYQTLSIWASIWLSKWTSDPILQVKVNSFDLFSTKLPCRSANRIASVTSFKGSSKLSH